MSQPRPKPGASRMSSTAGLKALIGVAAIGITMGSWAALSLDQRVEVVADASPIVTLAPPAPYLAIDSAPIPTIAPLVVPTVRRETPPTVVRPTTPARLPVTPATVAPVPPIAPALRAVNPPPAVSAPKPVSRTRSSR